MFDTTSNRTSFNYNDDHFYEYLAYLQKNDPIAYQNFNNEMLRKFKAENDRKEIRNEAMRGSCWS